MKRTVLTATLFAMGALTMMNAVADGPVAADEKKPKAPYTEFVTVRYFANGRLLDPIKDVSAFRDKSPGGEDRICVNRGDSTGEPPKGSEITDKDGKVYVVTRTTVGAGSVECYFTPKPAE